MNLFGWIPKVCNKYGGWILTILSSAGVVGTAVMVANEAPVAAGQLEAAEDEKGAELTFGEKFNIVAPIYLPSALVGGLTIACMIGAQIFNVKQQGMILAAYGLLAEQYHEYRKEVREQVGEDKEREIYLASQKKVRELEEKLKKLEEETGPQLYALAMLPGVIFESTPEHMERVFHVMMWNMVNNGGFSLYDLYDHIGLPKNCYSPVEAQQYGYCSYENEVTWGNPAVTFEECDVKRFCDGKIVHVIDTFDPPYELGLDYGGKDSSTDYIYEEYSFDRACELAQASTDDDVERFEIPEITIIHSF